MAEITQNAAGDFFLDAVAIGAGFRTIEDTQPVPTTPDYLTHFSGTININEPTYLICNRLNPQEDYVLNVNAPLYIRMIEGQDTLPNVNAGTLAGNSVDATVIVNRDQGGVIVWEATNGFVNGWGARQAMNTNSIVDNQRFIAFGTNGQWFVNVSDIGPVQLSGFDFVQTVFNSPNVNNNFNGFLFDGSRRPHLDGDYTFRYQSTSNAGNIIYNSVFSGDDYTDIVGNNKTLHYQYNGVTGADNILYSVNNLYENTNITIAGANNNNAVQPVVEGFSFNIAPTVIDSAGISSIITDAAVTGFSNLTRNIQATRDEATFLTTNAADGLINANGYFLETGRQEPNQGVNASTLAKALDWSTDGTLSVVAGFQPTLRLYSYTNRMDNQSTVISEANPFDIAADGTVTFRNRTIELGIDDLLVTGTVSTDYPSTFEVTTDLEAYRVAKSDWYTDRKQYDYPVTGQGDFTGMNVTFAGVNDLTSATAITINAGANYSGNLTCNAFTSNGQNLSNGTYTVDSITGNIGNVSGVTIASSGTTALTIGDVSDSVISTAGELTFNSGVSGINSFTATSITTGSLEPADGNVVDLTVNAAYSFTPNAADIVFDRVQWQTGAVTLPNAADFRGNTDMLSQTTVNSGATYSIFGDQVSFANVPTVVGTGVVTFNLFGGASAQSLFGMSYVDDPTDNIVISSDPALYNIVNPISNANGDPIGHIYINIVDQNGDIVRPTAGGVDNYSLSGAWLADANGDTYLPQNSTGEINFNAGPLGDNTWQLFTAGAGALDAVHDIVFSEVVSTINIAADQNWSTNGADYTDDWSLAVDTVSQSFTVNPGDSISTLTLTVPPQDGGVQAVGTFRVDGIANRQVTAINVDADNNIIITFSAAIAVAAGDDALEILVTYPGNNVDQFGVRMPAGGNYDSGSSVNYSLGLFKSNQDYVDYVTSRGFRADGTTRGIRFPNINNTELYFDGPTDGITEVEDVYVMELFPDDTPIIVDSLIHDRSGSDWQDVPLRFDYDSANPGDWDGTVRALVKFPAAINHDLLVGRIVNGLRVPVTIDTINGIIGDDYDNTVGDGINATGLNSLVTAVFNATVGVDSALFRGATIPNEVPDNALRNLAFRFTDSADEGPNGIFRITGFIHTSTTLDSSSDPNDDNNISYEYVYTMGVEWNINNFTDAEIIEWGLDNPTDAAADNTRGNLNITNQWFKNERTRINFSTEVDPTSAPPLRTYLQVTTDNSAGVQPVSLAGIQSFINTTANTQGLEVNDQTVVDLAIASEAANFNIAAVDGQQVRVTPLDDEGNPIAGAEVTTLNLNAVSTLEPEVNYNLIRANALSALREYDPATGEEITTVNSQVDRNNERLQSINEGDSSKIPIGRAYDADRFTPDTD